MVGVRMWEFFYIFNPFLFNANKYARALQQEKKLSNVDKK